MGVLLGAFGAHGLKNKLSPDMMDIYKTAVLYHLIHALGLFAVAWLSNYTLDNKVQTAGALLSFGIILFSGSLYVLSVTGLKWLGMVTPIGGLCFLTAWALIFFSKFSL
jgi:uncharacterized membrane protein YgdD (TMEM256/DUF423 family)